MVYYGEDGCTYEHRGDAIAAPDPPHYPPEWKPEQCLNAYWYAVGHHINANSTTSWYQILTAAEHESERRHNKIAEIVKHTTDEDNLF